MGDPLAEFEARMAALREPAPGITSQASDGDVGAMEARLAGLRLQQGAGEVAPGEVARRMAALTGHDAAHYQLGAAPRLAAMAPEDRLLAEEAERLRIEGELPPAGALQPPSTTGAAADAAVEAPGARAPLDGPPDGPLDGQAVSRLMAEVADVAKGSALRDARDALAASRAAMPARAAAATAQPATADELLAQLAAGAAVSDVSDDDAEDDAEDDGEADGGVDTSDAAVAALLAQARDAVRLGMPDAAAPPPPPRRTTRRTAAARARQGRRRDSDASSTDESSSSDSDSSDA